MDSDSTEKRETFIDKLSGDEKKKFYERNARLKREKKNEKANTFKEARKLVPRVLAEQLAEEMVGGNFRPSNQTIAKLKKILSSGYTLEEAKKKFFTEVSQKHWGSITVWLFKESVPNKEAVGFDIVNSRMLYIKSQQRVVKDLEKQTRSLKKDVKAMRLEVSDMKSFTAGDEQMEKDRAKEVSSLYGSIERSNIEINVNLMRIAKVRKDILKLEIEVAEGMKKVDLIGERSAAASINIHNHIERPKADEAIDVTPRGDN
jgi:hypothetical protein